MNELTFIDPVSLPWLAVEFAPGVGLAALAEPVPGGSIHLAVLEEGTVIPSYTHPADEYVYVLRGELETGGRRCEPGTFWRTPAGTRQGPHVARTSVELLTIRLGPMGEFDGGA